MPPYTRVEQLAVKIQAEFQAIFPSEPDFVIGTLEDISGLPLDYNSMVTEVMKSGASVFAY